MKKLFIKNGIMLVVSIFVSAILALAVGQFSWSFKLYSEMLAYFGIAIAIYGSYTASNMSNLFKGAKKDINKRYSPEEKKEKERLINHKLIDGWFTIFSGSIIIVLSILVNKL